MSKIEISYERACLVACRMNKCHCAIEHSQSDYKYAKRDQILEYALALPDNHHCSAPCNCKKYNK